MARQLTDEVWLVERPRVNVSLVDDDVLTLIDAGLPWDGPAIREAVREIGFDPDRIKRVLVTHFDLDHVGGLRAFPEAEAIHVGRADADYVRGDLTPRLSDRKRLFQRLTEFFRKPPQVPVSPVEDGETIGSFTAVHTPGHTPGHTAYYSDALDVVFAGDLVFSDGETLSLPPWYLSQNTDQLRASVSELASRLPPIEVLVSGHGEPLVSGGSQAILALAQETCGSGGNG
ncbi:metallo-beta-lactamase superfamily protein [Halodesulfurarchaeum formicicum]|uniref:Metallo-beta-lactamase superfamily protein n=1 Tax=Halodesulfurarchaeum formicicum TaxID=1873524 RepID=A0A1D8S2C5_9EURY|nr:MBL fold metallo-hydrolase [Halodesulfurarchaeum formicicum]AOW79505.1 metallo-beta-lactamase superfamily protein [Halodesulfurarchaeum formicicum]